MEDFKAHISQCFELVEHKLERGPKENWNTDDFNILSEGIQKTTGTQLSISTLKRLSGKISYSSKPNSSTLNALAGYVGFQDWRAFLKNLDSVQLEPKRSSSTNHWLKYGLPILVLVLGFVLLSFYLQSEQSYDPEEFTFESRPVSMGIPNSVVFDYDASAADGDSKIEIQQYWDETKRNVINRNDSVATSIYYHPGFFKSKLVVDDQVVRENDVFIPTEDWLGVIEREERPIYLDHSDIRKDGKIAITTETLASHDLDPKIAQVVVSFYQVMDFGDLSMGNFEMSATLRNDFEKGLSTCQMVQLSILYDGGAIAFPLAKKGCSSELTVMTFDEFVDGKKNDLSAFGVNFGSYVELKCISSNKKLDVLIDNKVVYSMDVPETVLKIKGIVIHFEGAGSVKNLEFKKDDQVVYSSNF